MVTRKYTRTKQIEFLIKSIEMNTSGISKTHSYLSDVKINFEKTKTRQPHLIKTHYLQFIIYMLRWQLSTPVMTPIVLIAHHIGIINSWACIGWTNLFCCVPFYFIDKFIFVHLRAKIQKVIDRHQFKKVA